MSKINNICLSLVLLTACSGQNAEQNNSMQAFGMIPDQEKLNIYEEAFGLPMEEGMRKLDVDAGSISADHVIRNLYVLNEAAEYESEEFEILLYTDQIDGNESIYAVTYRSVLSENSTEAASFVNRMLEDITESYGDPDTFEGLENRLCDVDIGLLIEAGNPASAYEEWILSDHLKAVYTFEILDSENSVITLMIRLV